jgi:hypothetical protein
MNIKSDYGRGIISTDVVGINNCEMRQMCDIKERIAQVLISHKNEKLKNEYLTDDELKMLHAMLRVFTKEYSESQTSAFDDELKAIEEEEKNMTKEPEPQHSSELAQ